MILRIRRCKPAGQRFFRFARAGGQRELPLAQWITAVALLSVLEKVWGLEQAKVVMCDLLLQRKSALALQCRQGRDGKWTGSDILPPDWAEGVVQLLCDRNPIEDLSEADQDRYYAIIATKLADWLTQPHTVPELKALLCIFFFDRNALINEGYSAAILPEPIDLVSRKEPQKLNERHRSDILPVTDETRVRWRQVWRHEIARRDEHPELGRLGTLPDPKDYMTEYMGKPLIVACYPRIMRFDMGHLRSVKAALYAGENYPPRRKHIKDDLG